MTESVLPIVALWCVFGLTHVGLSSQALRPRLVAGLGERGFLGVYSLVALAAFIPLCMVYAAHRHEGMLLWAVPIEGALRYALYALQVVAWMLVIGSFASPSPTSMVGSRADANAVNPLHRITRHPLFAGVGLFGALHLPFLGFASDVAFWAGFPIFGVIGCWHQDRRKRVSDGESFIPWSEQTSFWIRPRLDAMRALPLWLPVAALLLVFGLRWAHRWL